MNLPRREIVNEVNDELMNELLLSNTDIAQELQRSLIAPNDVKTLITSEGIYTKLGTMPSNIANVLQLVVNEQELTKAYLLGTIV
jgi:hypothetical protein